MHGIAQIDGEYAFASHREVPWHNLGVVVGQAMTIEEALILGGLNWEVKIDPLEVATYMGPVPIPNKYVTFRIDSKDGYVPLGIVGGNYEPIQNQTVIETLSLVADMTEGSIETIGALKNGSRIFATIKLDSGYKVGGVDAVDTYLLATSSHDGSVKFTILTTPVRVVCANTLRLATKKMKTNWTVKHTTKSDLLINEIKAERQLINDSIIEFNSIAERLADINITDYQAEKFAEHIFGLEGKETGAKRIAEERIAGLLDVYKNSTYQAGIVNNGWGLYNGYTEYLEYFRPLKNMDDTTKSKVIATSVFDTKTDAVRSDAIDYILTSL